MFELSNEQRDIKRAAREFAEGEFTDIAAEHDENETFPAGVWERACREGFVGVFIDERYEGPGLGMLEYAIILEEFWRVDAGIGNILLSTIGSEFVQDYGSEKQKEEYLVPLVQGKAILGTTGGEDRRDDGFRYAKKSGDEYVLNGRSAFVLNGKKADNLIVVAEGISNGGTRTGRYTTFIVGRGQEGVSAVELVEKLGVRASDISEVALRDVVVGPGNVIGVEGEGMGQFDAFLDRVCLYHSAQAIGASQSCLEKAVKYSRQRVQFGHPIGWFQMVQLKIGEMATRIEAARNLCYKAAWEFDHGRKDRHELSMASWFARETAGNAAAEAIQIHGGYGYMKELDIERFYRDVQFLEFFGKSREKTKMQVAVELLGEMG